MIPVIEWSRDHHTAIHEAGHVVAAWALGRAVDWVAIYPDTGGGRALIATLRDVDDITILAAGITAEHLNWPGKPDELDTGTMESGEIDRDRMVGLAQQLWPCLAPTDRAIQALRRFNHAQDILETHWSAVVMVAEALRREHTLSRERIVGIIEQATYQEAA